MKTFVQIIFVLVNQGINNIKDQFIEITKFIVYSHDALPGDTGGPLTYQGLVIGIVSWGFGFDMDSPTVFTRVSEVLPFIRKHM